MTSSAGPITFNLFDPEVLAEPHDLWKRLREHSPVQQPSDIENFFVVTRYEDVDAVFRNPELFSSDVSRLYEGGKLSPYDESPAVKEVLEGGACPQVKALLTADGELHNRHRKILMSGFTKRRVRQLEESIEGMALDLVNDLPLDTEVDLWAKLAVPLPIMVIGEILGTEHDVATIRRWSDGHIARFREQKPSEEENLEAARSLVELHQYLIEAITSRQEQPRDDFLSDMVQAGEGCPMAEMVNVCAQVLVAGSETTTNLIGHLLDLLVEHPDQLEAVRNDRSLIPAAVEEVLRYEGPIKLLYRVATCDTELGGVRIPENSVVLPVVASADRDALVRDEPDVFDIHAAHRQSHIAFGLGAHYCPGAHLARAEARIALGALLDRAADIRRGSARDDHVPNLTLRELPGLPLVLVSDAGKL